MNFKPSPIPLRADTSQLGLSFQSGLVTPFLVVKTTIRPQSLVDAARECKPSLLHLNQEPTFLHCSDEAAAWLGAEASFDLSLGLMKSYPFPGHHSLSLSQNQNDSILVLNFAWKPAQFIEVRRLQIRFLLTKNKSFFLTYRALAEGTMNILKSELKNR